MTEIASREQRRRTLELALLSLTQKGWVISSRTDTTAQLTRSGKKSGCLLLILLIFGVLPGILYAVWPASRETLFVIVDEQGQAHFSGSQGTQREIDSVLSQEKPFEPSLRHKETRLRLLESKQKQAAQKAGHAAEHGDSIISWTRVLLGLGAVAISAIYLGFLTNLGAPAFPVDLVFLVPLGILWLVTAYLISTGWNPVLWWWQSTLSNLNKEIPALEAQIQALRTSLKRGF